MPTINIKDLFQIARGTKCTKYCAICFLEGINVLVAFQAETLHSVFHTMGLGILHSQMGSSESCMTDWAPLGSPEDAKDRCDLT